MKKVILSAFIVLILLLTTFIFVYKNNIGDKYLISKTVNNYLTAVYSNDSQTVLENITDSDRNYADKFNLAMEEDPQYTNKFDITKFDLKKKYAQVKVRKETFYNTERKPIRTEITNINLLKEDGVWKVYLGLELVYTAQIFYISNNMVINNLKFLPSQFSDGVFNSRLGWFDLKNKGNAIINKAVITVYYLDKNNKPITEQELIPVRNDDSVITNSSEPVRPIDELKPNFTKKYMFDINPPSDWSGKVKYEISNIDMPDESLQKEIDSIKKYVPYEKKANWIEVLRITQGKAPANFYVDLNMINKEKNLHRFFIRAKLPDPRSVKIFRGDEFDEYSLVDCNENKSYLELIKTYDKNKLKYAEYQGKQESKSIGKLVLTSGLKPLICGGIGKQLPRDAKTMIELNELASKQINSSNKNMRLVNFYALVLDWYKAHNIKISDKNEENTLKVISKANFMHN